MKAALAIIVLLLVGCATTPREGILSEQGHEMCERIGGCVLMPKGYLQHLLMGVRKETLAECKEGS